MSVLHASATRQTYGAARMLVVAVAIAMALNRDMTIFSDFSLGEVAQIGMNSFIPFPLWQRIVTNEFALHAIQWSAVAALLLALTGVGRAFALTWGAIVLTFQECLFNGRNVLTHDAIGSLYVLYAMALFEWLNLFRGRKTVGTDNMPAAALFTMAAVFLATYSFVGIRRLAYGGPALLFSDTPGFWFVSRGYAGMQGYPELAWTPHLPEWPWLVHMLAVGLVATTTLEILAPLVLVSRKFRFVFLSGILTFHFMTIVSMDILFWQNMVLLMLLCDFGPWVAARAPQSGRSPIVYFDGVCGLCNRFVDTAIKWDPNAVLRFATIQGDTARERIGQREGDPEGWSLIYEDEHGTYERSEAVLRALQRLGWPYMVFALGRLCPRFVRDSVYRFVARNRYRWFGKRDACRLPTKEERARFLD